MNTSALQQIVQTHRWMRGMCIANARDWQGSTHATGRAFSAVFVTNAREHNRIIVSAKRRLRQVNS